MTLRWMENVGIVVEDLELKLEGRTTIEGEWAGRVTGLGDQSVEDCYNAHTRRLQPARTLSLPHAACRPGSPERPGQCPRHHRVMFAVDDIDHMLEGIRTRRAQIVGEVLQYKDAYRLCYIRGPDGLLIGLAQGLS